MSQELDYYRNLVKIIDKTRGTRFTAATSLQFQDRFSVGTTAILTVFLIAISIFLLVEPTLAAGAAGKHFGILSAISSIWILVITLSDTAKNRQLVAHQLQQNALKIAEILREMEREIVKDAPRFVELRKCAARYEKEVQETQINHLESDYKKYLLGKESPTSKWDKVWLSIRKTVYGLAVFCTAVSANLLILLFVIAGTLAYVL